MTSKEIKNQIEKDQKLKLKILNQLAIIQNRIEDNNKLLIKLEKEEQEAELMKLGFKLLNKYKVEENEINNSFIIFDKKGNFIKSVNRNQELKDAEAFENYLKQNKLYAHRASSFRYRHKDFYNWSLKEQLQNLCWEFNSRGYLKNTSW